MDSVPSIIKLKEHIADTMDLTESTVLGEVMFAIFKKSPETKKMYREQKKANNPK